MSRVWTEKQLEAIQKQGDLLVSAAAGAGKTAVLTERIARLIAGGMGVDELLVVTFTRAAAAEMKERIGKRLSALSDEVLDSGDPERAALLRRAAAACESANISTIHSFCTNVLHRNYHEVGLDPAFRVAEELESELLAKKALDEVLEEQYAENEKHKDPGFNALLNAVGSDRRLEELMRSLYRFAQAQPDPEAWLDGAAEKYTTGFAAAAAASDDELMDRVTGELQVFMDAAKGLREGPASDHPRIASALDDDMSFMLGLMLGRDHDKWVASIGSHTFSRLTWNSGTDEGEKAEVKEYRERLKKYHGDLKKRFAHTLAEEEGFSRLLAPPIITLRALVGRFTERFAAFKQEEGLIDFNDMEQLTLRILRNERIADEYRRRFKAVFVDEYQDINPAQEAILSAVSSSNRFMVGDVKQSIYRFRQAEPAIFLEKYNTYKGEDGRFRIDLNANFRSRPIILEAANALFSKLMRGGSVGEIDYSDNASLVSGFAAVEGAPRGTVELTLIDPEPPDKRRFPYDDDDEDDDEDQTNAALQAAFAARRILEIMSGEQLYENGVPRRYRFSDFTVLLRSVAPVASEWLRTLADAGIPCVCDSGPGFFDALEVRLFIDLLRVIDNRRQDIPLLAVMRSSVFGFTDDELIHIKADYEGEDVLDRVLAAAADRSAPSWSVKAGRMLGVISSWREKLRLYGLTELMGAVLDETGLMARVSALFGGEARARNLASLCDIALRYANTGKATLSGFIRFLDDSRDSAPAGASVSPNIDAVRLMTIHHSKGLEFPVVILGDITKGFNRSSNSAVGIFDSRLGIGLCSVSGDRGEKSLLQRAIAFRELRRQNSEEMRMLYVAQTRAREKLIMVGVKRNAPRFAARFARPMDGVRVMNASSYADWMLGAYFPQGADIPLRLPSGEMPLNIIGTDAAGAARIGMSEDEFAAWLQDAAFIDPGYAASRFESAYPYSEEAKLPSKLSVTGLTVRIPEVSLRPRFMEAEREFTPAEVGTLTHRLLQLIPIAPHTKESAGRELSALTAAGVFTGREAGAVSITSIVDFFASDLGRRLIASPRVLREREFNLRMPARALTDSASEAAIMLQGVIDCCFMEDGAWVLIDHKTTRVDKAHTPRSVAERYRRQLELYSLALEKLTGTPVKESWVYLLSVNEAVRL
ncbi:MAG: UvrD-helicase domain-containing protein [Clostridia bacterium]|nr:UvrD-helicase domain-containing protein [Clostridia bacterium]